MERRQSRAVFAGGVQIGGDAPVSVQSMLNVPAHDVEGNVAQAKSLYEAGCEIIRAAVPDLKSVQLIPALKKAVPVPVVADIHFDYRIALACVEAGVDKIRINPGNIGSDERVKAVADACRAQSIPIRIGVNSGSLEKEILAKHGAPTAQALAESAMYHVRLLEKCDFYDIVISIKSSDVQRMVEAYEIIAAQCDYPLHLGVTEAGTARMGLIKSSAGIGSLLLHGIGDTIRVSLTDAPVNEVYAGFDILKAVGSRRMRPRSFPADLRAYEDRSDWPGRPGGGAVAGLPQADQGGGHGLRSQRPRRSARGGYRCSRRRRLRPTFQKGRDHPQGAGGSDSGRTDAGDRKALRGKRPQMNSI